VKTTEVVWAGTVIVWLPAVVRETVLTLPRAKLTLVSPLADAATV